MKVLLVEDEPTLRDALKSGLSLSFPTFEIEAVESAEAAEEKIDGNFSPRLVISDVRLPGKSGVDLVLDLQDLLVETQFILMSAYTAPEALERIRPHRMLRFLQKPFELGLLIKEVQSAFVKDQFSGTHRRITFVDVLQMLNMAKRTARLGIRGVQSEEIGAIYVVAGEVHHAELGETEGLDAFRALCASSEALFRVKSDVQSPRQTIDMVFNLLLMDALGEEDEDSTEEVFASTETVRESLDALCREMVEGLPEAVAAAVFDLVSRECLGSCWSASFPESHTAAMSRLAEHVFRGSEMEAVAEIMVPAVPKRPAPLTEVQLKSDAFCHCLARLAGQETVVWLALDAAASPGMGWAVLRMASSKMGPLAAARKGR